MPLSPERICHLISIGFRLRRRWNGGKSLLCQGGLACAGMPSLGSWDSSKKKKKKKDSPPPPGTGRQNIEG